MRTPFVKTAIGLLLFLPQLSSAYELGAWYKRVPEIPRALNTRYDPSFLILKIGIFSKTGKFKIVAEPSQWKSLCAKNYKLTAWVTHRLSKNDSLTPSAAELLASQLNRALANSCFSAVELDIETLNGTEEWLFDFLKKLRADLVPVFKLKLAVPILSEETLLGASWKKQSAEKILSVIDGIDVMLYDSGIKELPEYLKLISQNIRWSSQLTAERSEKSVLIGIPAYHERIKLHRDNIESIASFTSALKNLTAIETQKICSGQTALSFYAGWTLSPEDRKSIDELKKWLSEACQKGSR